MMNVAIYGAGGHGRVVLDILLQAGHHVECFLDTSTALHGRRVDGVEVIGGMERLADLPAREVGGVVVAIGDNGVRRAMANHIDAAGLRLVNAVHPSANLARTVSLGRNVVIAAGALVCAHCQIGDSVILNTGCVVDHESMIGTAVHVCPGVKLAGRVTVEAGAFIGIGASVIQNVRIGREAIIGAGSVIIRDVPAGATMAGVPARVIRPAPALTDDELTEMLAPRHLRSHPTRQPTAQVPP
jgi:sugar O-acyltransferase (sialic acid O-acetyltransferase NeuD family)